jgi:hypothetical protein
VIFELEPPRGLESRNATQWSKEREEKDTREPNDDACLIISFCLALSLIVVIVI